MFKVDGNASIQFENLSKAIGNMVSGTQITRLFTVCGLHDIDGEGFTKYKRIYDSFAYELNNNKSDAKIINFLESIFDLTNFNNDSLRFNQERNELNSILIYLGCQINEQGKMVQTEAANTINEALTRLNVLQLELQKRNIHSSVMKYCSKEYLSNNYFHACFEAIKGLFSRLKDFVNLQEDGNKLLDLVFSKERPLITINSMSSITDKDEFEGLKNLLLFLHKSIRNYEAHKTRLNNEVDLDRTLDIFVCVSLAHRYLDRAQRTCFVLV